MALKEDIKKQFGDQVVLSGNSIVDKDQIIIPVSPALDLGLGGGIPEGSFVIFTGQPKCGKTTSSLDFTATALNKKYQGALEKPRQAFYLNIEGRLKKRDLQGIMNLDLDRFEIIGSQQGKILHGEEYLAIAERIINEIPGSILIIDSYSALCTEAEITSDMSKMQRADGAKLLSKFCRKVANVIPVNKNIVIGITHLMGNPTGYGKAFKEKSGQAVAYQTDVKLWAEQVEAWNEPATGPQIGQKVTWKIVTSALGPPGAKSVSYLRYGHGIDGVHELTELCADLGIIKKGGAWYTLISVKDTPKFQGAAKVRDYLTANPKVADQLHKELKEMMGLTI